MIESKIDKEKEQTRNKNLVFIRMILLGQRELNEGIENFKMIKKNKIAPKYINSFKINFV